jgi:hypothetical protein
MIHNTKKGIELGMNLVGMENIGFKAEVYLYAMVRLF